MFEFEYTLKQFTKHLRLNSQHSLKGFRILSLTFTYHFILSVSISLYNNDYKL